MDKDIRAFVYALSAGGSVSAGAAMSDLTTLGIGGPAEIYYVPRDTESLAMALAGARECGMPVTVLGGGSNLLVRDAGIDGLVVTTGFATDIAIDREDATSAVVSVGAGVPLQRLINFLVERGLAGLEGLGGVPGLVGGAIAGNAGSFGMEMRDVLMSATLVGPEGAIEVDARELKMGYRTASLPEGSVIAGAKMRLIKDEPHDVRARLARWLAEKKAHQPLSARSAGCESKAARSSLALQGIKPRRFTQDLPVSANSCCARLTSCPCQYAATVSW